MNYSYEVFSCHINGFLGKMPDSDFIGSHHLSIACSTRMHSIRMRTIRCSDRRGDTYPGEVVAREGVYLPGGRGVTARGCTCSGVYLCWGCIPAYTEADTPL